MLAKDRSSNIQSICVPPVPFVHMGSRMTETVCLLHDAFINGWYGVLVESV